MDERKQVIGYTRVSTATQAVQGISLEAQRSRIRAWCELTGVTLVAIHCDSGISGSRASNRPALQKALTDACRVHGVLVVFSLSRLARSTKDAILIAERLEKGGADLVSLSENIDTTSAAGKMVFRLLAVMAEFEKDLISERTTAALAHLRNTGRRFSGETPYGYLLKGDRLVPVRREQETVTLVRRMRSRGMSLRAIARALVTRKIRTKAGGAVWSPKVLSALLRRSSDVGRAVA
ncbi:MAG TPA: recombinase family protein [Thermoanaerobaculia bacterium]|nr:recombinase family protein [Thermoanaerobaculia bacterium]